MTAKCLPSVPSQTHLCPYRYPASIAHRRVVSPILLGSEGSIVSLAAVVPELVIALFDAVQAGDLTAARNLNERIYPLARAIYRADPAGGPTRG